MRVTLQDADVPGYFDRERPIRLAVKYDEGRQGVTHLAAEDLQEIVQQAYDHYHMEARHCWRPSSTALWPPSWTASNAE